MMNCQSQSIQQTLSVHLCLLPQITLPHLNFSNPDLSQSLSYLHYLLMRNFDNPKSSSTNSQSKPSIPVIPSSTNTNTLPQPLPTLPVDVIIDNTNPKSSSTNFQSKPSILVIPSSTNTNTLPHPLPTVPVNEIKPIPDPDHNSLPFFQSLSNPSPPTSSIIPDSTNPKSGDADELYSDTIV